RAAILLKGPEGFAGPRDQSQQWRGQGRGAERIYIAHGRAEPRDQVLIEHADDDAHVGTDAANQEGRGKVHQVVAGDDDDAAGLGEVGFLQDVALPAIALKEAGGAEPRGIRPARRVEPRYRD